MLGALTASELNVAPTCSSSFLWLMIPNVENLSSAANDAFSRTVRPAAKPSACRSEGMKAASCRSSLVFSERP